MISFLILGAGGAIPTPERGPAAYWLDFADRGLLIDPGPGALVRLMRDPRTPDSLDEVDAVLFTHLHLDHCADLPALLFALRSPVLRSERRLQLIGPRGLAGYLERLGELYGHWIVPERRPLEILELDPGDTLVPGPDGAPWRRTAAGTRPALDVFAVEHSERRFSAANLGLEIRDERGRRLVFSSDTGPGGELPERARGAELLVVECTTPDAYEMDGHLSPARVAALCAEAAPKRVVLTHIYPDTAADDPAARVAARWAGPVTAAVDGDRFDLGDG